MSEGPAPRIAGREPRPAIVLAYWTLKDPRDLAEAIHLAAAAAAEVHLLGRSLRPDHPKVLRKLRSWRPDLAERPETMPVRVVTDPVGWALALRESGFRLAAAVVAGGSPPPAADPARPVAVLFGEETHGLPEDLLAAAGERWSLPMGEGGRFFTVGQATALILGRLGRP